MATTTFAKTIIVGLGPLQGDSGVMTATSCNDAIRKTRRHVSPPNNRPGWTLMVFEGGSYYRVTWANKN